MIILISFVYYIIGLIICYFVIIKDEDGTKAIKLGDLLGGLFAALIWPVLLLIIAYTFLEEHKDVIIWNPSNSKTIARSKQVLEKWAALKYPDICWRHNEIMVELCEIFGVEVRDIPLPPKEQFQEECKLYMEKIYGKS